MVGKEECILPEEFLDRLAIMSILDPEFYQEMLKELNDV